MSVRTKPRRQGVAESITGGGEGAGRLLGAVERYGNPCAKRKAARALVGALVVITRNTTGMLANPQFGYGQQRRLPTAVSNGGARQGCWKVRLNRGSKPNLEPTTVAAVGGRQAGVCGWQAVSSNWGNGWVARLEKNGRHAGNWVPTAIGTGRKVSGGNGTVKGQVVGWQGMVGR